MTVVTELEQLSRGGRLRLDAASSLSTSRNFHPDASIVLVGSRGSGKRTLGFIGATHLGRRLVTEDHYFEEATGKSRGDFLRQYGNKEFYQRSVEVLKQMLDNNRTGCLIECGMGSLAKEAQDALAEFAQQHPVIYITRNSDRIRKLLNLGKEEAARLEAADLAHRRCSNMEYYNLHDPSCDGTDSLPDYGSPTVSARLKHAKQDFCSFLDFITGQGILRRRFESPFSIAALPPECRLHTYALSLRTSHLQDLDLDQLDYGADAVQLRIDNWAPDIQKLLAMQIAIIRRKLGIPVLLHVTESLVGGVNSMPPTTLREQEVYFMLLECALRVGVEYISLDLRYPHEMVRRVIRASGRTKIIGHYLAPFDLDWHWDDEARIVEYQTARSLGCDLVRYIRMSRLESDNHKVRAFLARIDSLGSEIPVIAYNLGDFGRASVIANKIFTPVTHPVKDLNISLGELQRFLPTAAEAMRALYQNGTFDPLHFYHLGASVFYSLSPAMHTAAYEVCGMSHDFHSLQVSSIEHIHRLCQDPDFGGAAITQPFKVEIMSQIGAISYHAKAIGAVNTLLPLRKLPRDNQMDGSTQSLLLHANQRNKAGPVIAYYGDNTDFIGIMNSIRRNISPRNVVQPSKTTGLVIGAGGMARAAIYALIQLGCRKIFMFNRTVEHAEAVARHFNTWTAGLGNEGDIVRVLKSREDPWPVGYKQPTIIISCVPAASVQGQAPANFEMPLHWFESPTGGVVCEIAYKPLDTLLLKQTRRIRSQTKQAWVIVNGLEVLPEQAIAQFELMTGRKAPKSRMRAEVLKNLPNYQ
ncbi:quinate pathway repressor protein-like protein QutR [Xylogone sp. PMI_703]|nr:quinate pathway repressor protein-like protein QutR [Xylogone sp. PMI_703]